MGGEIAKVLGVNFDCSLVRDYGNPDPRATRQPPSLHREIGCRP